MGAYLGIKSYIKDLVDDNLSKLTFKYSGLVDSKIANNTQAVISVPEILVNKKYFFDGEKIILFGDSTKTIKFNDTTYNTVSGSSWPQVASKDINSTNINEIKSESNPFFSQINLYQYWDK